MSKILFSACCLAASISWAQDNETTNAENDEKVDLYVSVIENIDVTAEKAPASVVEETDTDIDAILDEAEALEGNEE